MDKINLTESQLRDIVRESVSRFLKEEDVEEGWFGDKINQAKSAYNTATQKNKNLTLKDRVSKAKKNWNTQGELNNLNNLKRQLSHFVDSGQLNPQMTIAQLIGGKYNNGKFGRISSMTANRQGQIKRRGGTSYEEE